MGYSYVGPYGFLTLHRTDDPRGGPLVPREQCEVINRPGVNGTAVLRTGKRSEPFTMRSFVDVASLAIVPTAVQSYQSLIGTVVNVIWQDTDYQATYGVRFAVLDCVCQSSRRVLARAGGAVAGSTAVVEILWTLQPVLEVAE